MMMKGRNRTEVYQRVIDSMILPKSIREQFHDNRSHLEDRVTESFNRDLNHLKLIGSAATNTLTINNLDLDYAMVFNEKPSVEETIEKLGMCPEVEVTKFTSAPEGYSKISGMFRGISFVFVPMERIPFGQAPRTYVEDAYHHPDIINKIKSDDHVYNSLLTKRFFRKTGHYDKIQGISCELMNLAFPSFNSILEHLTFQDRMRVNLSPYSKEYSDNRIIVDYPLLGGKSLTKDITPEVYHSLSQFANKVRQCPEALL